jgi:phosphoribosylglycinamide formyltransferase 1
MTAPLRIAALASGRGSNLAALIEARDRGELAADFVLVGSDKANAGALRIAGAAGIPFFSLDPRQYASRREFDVALFDRIAASGAELLVLAGFMRIIDPEALAPWVGRTINVHPSLLPKYRGLHTHRRAIEAGDAEHGASVHFVTAELDGGPVIAQRRIAVLPADTEQSLAERLLGEEHRLLPAAVTLFCTGRLGLIEGRCALDGVPYGEPLRMDDRGIFR